MGSAPTGVTCGVTLDLGEASREDNVMKSVVSSPGEDYDAPHLAKNAANYTALTPLVLLRRAAAVYPDKIAVIHRTARFTYRNWPAATFSPQAGR